MTEFLQYQKVNPIPEKRLKEYSDGKYEYVAVITESVSDLPDGQLGKRKPNEPDSRIRLVAIEEESADSSAASSSNDVSDELEVDDSIREEDMDLHVNIVSYYEEAHTSCGPRRLIQDVVSRYIFWLIAVFVSFA